MEVGLVKPTEGKEVQKKAQEFTGSHTQNAIQILNCEL